MIRLAWTSVRRRLGGLTGLFLTAALTLALLTSSGLLMLSALTSGPGDDRFDAASITIAVPRSVTLTATRADKNGTAKIDSKTKPLTGAAVLPVGLAGSVGHINGVMAAVPDVAFPVDLTTPSGLPLRGAAGTEIVAHGWSSAQLTPFTLRSGVAPGPGQIVVDSSMPVRVGAALTLSDKTGPHHLTVSGITSQALNNQGAVFLSDAEAAQISGLSGPTAVAVFVRPGADVAEAATQIRSLTGSAQVFVGADRIDADLPGALISNVAAISVFGIMLAVTTFSALFVLVGVIGLVMQQRLREMALFRAVGATPRQLSRMVVAETTLAVLFAAPIGVAAGIWLSSAVADRFSAAGLVPAQFSVTVSPFVVAGAVAAGAVISAIAALLAGRRTVRIAPAEALRESVAVPPPKMMFRGVLAVALLAGAVAIETFTPLATNMGQGMSFLACALLLCAAVAVGPMLIRLVGAALHPAILAVGVSGRLAGATISTDNRRVAAVAMPVMLLVGLVATLMLTGSVTDQVSDQQQADRVSGAQTRLAAAGSGVPLAVAEHVAALPGVTGAVATLPTTVMVDEGGKPQHYQAQGLMLDGHNPLDLRVQQGSLDMIGGDRVAVSGDLSATQHWTVGSEATIWLADATRITATVAAVYSSSRGFGDVVLPAGLVVEHDPRGLVRAMYLDGEPSNPKALDGLPLHAHQQGLSPAGTDNPTQHVALTVIIAILGCFIGLGVINAFAVSIAARRREFADLRLAGATAAQLHRMVDVETLVSVVAGLLLGAGIAAAVCGTFSVAQDGIWRWVSNPAGCTTLIGGTTLLGLLAGAIPARLIVRRRGLAIEFAAG